MSDTALCLEIIEQIGAMPSGQATPTTSSARTVAIARTVGLVLYFCASLLGISQ